MSQTLLDAARQTYETAISHSESIDAKAGSLIGYSGIIATFIGFLLETKFVTISDGYKFLIPYGVALSVLSIVCALIVLVPWRKTRYVLDIRKFVKDSITNHLNDEQYQIISAINDYMDLAEETMKNNSVNAVILYIGNILLGIGVFISFWAIFIGWFVPK